jgi:hypothetical protein
VVIRAQLEGHPLLINDFVFIRDLIYELVVKFDGYDEDVANSLNSLFTRGYVHFNKNFMQKCQSGVTLQQVEQFVTAGGDLGFADSQGNTCLTYLTMAKPGTYDPNLPTIMGGWISGYVALNVLYTAVMRNNISVVQGVVQNFGNVSDVMNSENVYHLPDAQGGTRSMTALEYCLLTRRYDMANVLLGDGFSNKTHVMPADAQMPNGKPVTLDNVEHYLAAKYGYETLKQVPKLYSMAYREVCGW